LKSIVSLPSSSAVDGRGVSDVDAYRDDVNSRRAAEFITD